MTDRDVRCRRCGRALAGTPVEVEHLAWSDARRVASQGWLGRCPEEAVGVECLTHEEADFLLPHAAGPPRRTGRFARSPDFVADWMLA
jgi:hypothetical protein